jgi:hypothetical protein
MFSFLLRSPDVNKKKKVKQMFSKIPSGPWLRCLFTPGQGGLPKYNKSTKWRSLVVGPRGFF